MNGHEIEAEYLRERVKFLEAHIAVIEIELAKSNHILEAVEEAYKGVF